MTDHIKATGGTAFPMQDSQSIHAYAAAQVEGITDTGERDRLYMAARAQAIGGMTLRDYFAGQVVQGAVAGHIAHYGHENHWSVTDIADYAYDMADAMLRAREGGAA